jgi:hypothetical protein
MAIVDPIAAMLEVNRQRAVPPPLSILAGEACCHLPLRKRCLSGTPRRGLWYRAMVLASLADRSDPLLVHENLSSTTNDGWLPSQPLTQPANRRRWTMPTVRVAKLSVHHMRRWIAWGLFRIASCVLRSSINCYERHVITPIVLRAALSLVRILERTAVVMLFGSTARREGHERDIL